MRRWYDPDVPGQWSREFLACPDCGRDLGHESLRCGCGFVAADGAPPDLHALAVMGRYSKPPRVLVELVYRLGRAFPLLAPRKSFRRPDRDEKVDELLRTAGIAFDAEKIAT